MHGSCDLARLGELVLEDGGDVDGGEVEIAEGRLEGLLHHLGVDAAAYDMFRDLVWILLGIVIPDAVIYNLISLFGCRPIAASWDLSLATTAKCLDQLTKYMALSVLTIIIDVFELVLIPIVIPLQMSKC
ncbi:hypothetical protein DPSP01_010355 [Paraphaeosphaeria sporulosa]